MTKKEKTTATNGIRQGQLSLVQHENEYHRWHLVTNLNYTKRVDR